MVCWCNCHLFYAQMRGRKTGEKDEFAIKMEIKILQNIFLPYLDSHSSIVSFSNKVLLTFFCAFSLNVRIVLLIRDPRGSLQSRKHRIWCPGNYCVEKNRAVIVH